MIKYSQAPKYSPSPESTGGRHDPLNGGPEFSKFDIARHESMRLRYPKRILQTIPTHVLLCSECGISINTSDNVVIDGIPFHGSCFNAKNSNTR